MQDDPVIRVVRGVPTAEELAALVGVLLTRAPDEEPAAPVRSRWAASGRPAVPLRPGPGAWVGSARPR
jgi:Acyl-CoA carboxylase epsilon subunit